MSKLALISVYDTAEPERSWYENFLFDLLAERKPWECISHKEMPSLEDHIKFVRSKPYKKWYILQQVSHVGSSPLVGAVYLTHNNEIGIFIEREHQKRGWGSKALQALMVDSPTVKTFYANIGTFNSRSLAFFNMKRFQHMKTEFEDGALKQYVYRFDVDIKPQVIEETLPKAHAQSS